MAALSASGTATLRAFSSAGPPTSSVRPSTWAVTPTPGMAWKLVAEGGTIPRSLADRTMPWAMVCSESRSTAPASRSASCSAMPPVVVMPTTPNSPRVKVPVLSKTMAVRLRASSSPRRSRTRSPPRAPRVVEMAITNGTARPRACGQEITSTVTSRSTAKAGSPRRAIHATNVSAPATDGRHGQPERRSVRQRLRSGSRGLRLLDEPHDAGQRRLVAGAGDLDPERSGSVDRSRDHALTRCLLHRP